MAEARLFQALSDPTRLKIVGLLAAGPLNVTSIVNRVRAAQPAVSRHLRILREVGLIRDKRLGKEVEYSLQAGRVREASAWLGDLAVAVRAMEEEGESAGTPRIGDTAYGDRVAGSSPESAPKEQARSGSERARPRRERVGEPRPLRISPLQARAGVAGRGVAAGEEIPEDVGEARQGADALAGVETCGSERLLKPPRSRAVARRGAGARRKPPRAQGPKPQKGKRRGREKAPRQAAEVAEPESAFVVDRGDDAMDDFLL
jgi:DNA-binding transcriptional ArsR family regulator